jgi:predicted O-methyltransferase YrrM
MNSKWLEVDSYIEQRVLGPDPVLDAALAAAAAAGLPRIAVSAAQGKQLELLARLAGAKRILEVGTLGGYSAICLARALPADGYLLTLEIDPRHAEVARQTIDSARLPARIEIRLGPALETLAGLSPDVVAPFDVVFIDADKRHNPQYLEWAVKLGRPGTLIVVDNVVRDGEMLLESSRDADVRGIRRTYELLGSHPRIDATIIQTVGSKGYDGFALALVKAEAPGTQA